MDTRIKLTKTGKTKVRQYIAEIIAKRKEILDAKLDTASDTDLPSVKDIICDIAWNINLQKDPLSYSEYMNTFGVTDNYNADTAIVLMAGNDFTIIPLLGDFFKWDYLVSDDEDKEWWIIVEGKGEMPYELNLSTEYMDDECCRVEIDGQFYYFGDNPNADLN